jgi:hypothetical protein
MKRILLACVNQEVKRNLKAVSRKIKKMPYASLVQVRNDHF